MRQIKSFLSFVKNGQKVFYQASRGEYSIKSEEVSKIEKDLFSRKNSNIQEDKVSLYSDRKKVEKDIRTSYNNIVLNNG